jgi:hypothetical protein
MSSLLCSSWLLLSLLCADSHCSSWGSAESCIQQQQQQQQYQEEVWRQNPSGKEYTSLLM